MDLGDECVKVLWTGGWDSTFRLLDVVLVHGASVQPFYVLDTARRSSIVELNTMQRIRRSVAAISQKKAALIRPSTIVSIHDIRPDRDITDRYVRLKARSFLGEQYDWLARFVRQFGFQGLELCVHVDDKAHVWLDGHVEEVKRDDGQGYWVLRASEAEPDLTLFAPFRFPLLTLRKTDMQRAAEANGFLHILEQSWFCFTPVRNRPCGICNPCQSVIKEGQARRLPRAAKIRSFFLPVSRPFRRVFDKVARLAAATW